jgi:STE24 endopeptidase
MQPIAMIILFFMILDFVINFVADVLNLKGLNTSLPRALEELYEPEQYKKSQSYLRVNTRFGWAARTFDLFVLLIFWFGGGFSWLDSWVRGLGMSAVPSGLIYIGVLLACKALLDIPFSIYATFVIEERFGFNKTTWKTYLKDRVKGIVLSLLLGGPLLATILAFFLYTGPNAWWYCWLATVGFMLVVQYIAPTWIMPLFNRFDPLPQGELRQGIVDYAESIRFTLDNIFVMDGSKRSSKSNAFFTGFGRHRRIVLFDTLIERHTVDELVAVLAHEMGHYKEKHIIKNIGIGILQSGLMFFLLSFFISYSGLFTAFYVEHISIHPGLVFFGMIYAPLDGLMGMAVGALSRKYEYAADRFAVKTSGKGRAMISALKKLSADNLSNVQPHPFYVFLNYSHPPLLERVEAIERVSAS